MAILIASLAAGMIGFAWLTLFGRPTAVDGDTGSMDVDVPDHAVPGRGRSS